MPYRNPATFKLIVLASQAILFVILAFSFVWIRGCALSRVSPKPHGDCTSENEVREDVCPAGEAGRRLEICKEGKWIESFNDCKAGNNNCSETVFNRDVAPILTGKCVSCHPGYDAYETAKAKADAYITRIKASDVGIRMPKGGEALPPEEIAKFEKWKVDGLLPACAGEDTNNNPHIDLNYIEEAIQNDLSTLNSAEQLEARYLVTSHKSNEKAGLNALKQFNNAVNKASNSLSFSKGIFNAVAVDQFETVFRISTRSLRISANDWKLIEDNEVINLESNTNLGRLIKSIVRTRKPWLHIDSFAFAANQANVYYAIRKIPANINTFFNQIGLNFGGDIANFSALHVGFADSPISLNKNRLLVRFDTQDGNSWISFDTDNQQNSADRNLFQFPLIRSSSGNANFKFDASEMIFSLPNSLHGYVLFASNAQVAAAAPQTIVQDNVSPFSSEIKNSLSCYRCHNGGYIAAQDEVRASVLANAAQFDPRDVEFVEQLYRDPNPFYTSDNGEYNVALSKMGILASEADPVNLVTDNLRRDMNAKQIAALLFLEEQQFLDGVSRSAALRAQIGQILTGGVVNFAQLIASLPTIIKDLRLGQEPLN